MDRLTDVELECLMGCLFENGPSWRALVELRERRAADAKVREAIDRFVELDALVAKALRACESHVEGSGPKNAQYIEAWAGAQLELRRTYDLLVRQRAAALTTLQERK